MISVWSVFVGFSVFVVVVNAEAKPFESATTECKAKLSTSAEDIKIMMSGEKFTTRGSQCLAACIEKKVGMRGSDNKINMEKTAEMFSFIKSDNPDLYDKLMSITKDCKAKETAEADECVAAKKFYDCWVEKKEAAGIPKRDMNY